MGRMDLMVGSELSGVESGTTVKKVRLSARYLSSILNLDKHALVFEKAFDVRATAMPTSNNGWTLDKKIKKKM